MEEFNVFSQEVPFYQWEIDNNKPTVFGGQRNNWRTNNWDNGGVFSYKYQDLDRLLQQSRYFRTTNLNQTDYFRGYIYSVDGSGNLNPDYNYWLQNPDFSESITMGAPFYFYFGLKQGSTAFDKFAQSYLDFDDTTY
jgi:hypothetical protein